MTDYSNLLEEGRIKRGTFSGKQVEDCLEIADRDLKAARENLESNPEWAYLMAYNAMQQAGRALIF
ncbi:HEPN domain-containing protein [Gemmatimonadota bacterium]